MNIAFVILAHKYPEQLIRLARRLNAEGGHCYIHVDRRAAPVFAELSQLLAATPDAFLVKDRQACRWGQFGIVSATLAALRQLTRAASGYDYVVLLSGQDYPIKPAGEIRRFLERHRGQQFIEAFPLAEPNKWSGEQGAYQAMRRVAHWHVFLRSRHFHVPIERTVPEGLVPYGGSQWWALTGDCVDWMLAYLERHPQVTAHFRHTFVPDETFFQTLVCNSPYRQAVVHRALVHVDWSNPNPTLPRVMTTEDLEALKRSDRLFARKFEPGLSSEVLRAIDGWG
jgi:hypothetical protein